MRAAALAARLAALGLVEEVARVAAAVPGRDAIAVGAAEPADRPADAPVVVVVAEEAGAGVGAEAVGVLGAGPAALGLAEPAGRGQPALGAAAEIGPDAAAAGAAAVAVRLAGARLAVALVALAAVDYRDPLAAAGAALGDNGSRSGFSYITHVGRIFFN